MVFQSVVSQLSLVLLLSTVISIDAAKWTYEGDTGPEFWATLHGGELCDGQKQSPINIDTDTVVPKEMGIFEFEGFNMETKTGTSIANNGHTVQVTLDEEGTYKVAGGGLPTIYTAVQFHFHWGADNSVGSEHTRNGAQYPAEVHIVMYDHEHYDDILAAMTEPEGLAVLGFWIQVGEENPAFNSVIGALGDVSYKGESVEFSPVREVRLNDILPRNTQKFYRYSGSLTTPGCFESVVWTVFEEPITMSNEQLAMFRTLLSVEVGEAPTVPIGHNYRPTQALNGRTVYENMPEGTGGAGGVSYNILSVLLLSIACVLFNFL